MIAYKGFTKDLTARLGKEIFQYEIGKKYTEKSAECANTGFHCVEEPMRVFDWYDREDDRFCMVEISKDIHEDGKDRISAASIRILKELTRVQIAALECEWIIQHPQRKHSSRVAKKVRTTNGIGVARGKRPYAAGEKDSYLFLLQEDSSSPEIMRYEVYVVDGEKIPENKYINIDGKVVPNVKER